MALNYRVRDRLSGPAREFRLVVSDAGGGIVAEVALGAGSEEWRRARWVPGTAGAFSYAVAATDLAGNAGVSASAAVDVKALAVLAIGRSVRGRPITVTRFGEGRRRLLVVGASTATRPGRPWPVQFVRYLLAHRARFGPAHGSTSSRAPIRTATRVTPVATRATSTSIATCRRGTGATGSAL